VTVDWRRVLEESLAASVQGARQTAILNQPLVVTFCFRPTRYPVRRITVH
jgi:hypothetical protein